MGGGGLQAVQEVFGEAAIAAQQEALSSARLLSEHVPTEAEENQLRVGLMKLQWWRDGMESAMEAVEKLSLEPKPAAAASSADGSELGNAAHAQPVLNMLAIASKQYRLTGRWLTRMLDARERSLTDGPPEDINALLAHAESTSSALLYLTLECINVRNVHADHAASHIGKAIGILLTLRSLPYSASKQQIFIPKNILKQVRLARPCHCVWDSTPLALCLLDDGRPALCRWHYDLLLIFCCACPLSALCPCFHFNFFFVGHAGARGHVECSVW